jgi:hypothetical protein
MSLDLVSLSSVGCAGAIRPLYREVFSAIRVIIAA